MRHRASQPRRSSGQVAGLLAVAITLAAPVANSELLVGVSDSSGHASKYGYKAYDPDTGAFLYDYIRFASSNPPSTRGIVEGFDGDVFVRRGDSVARYEGVSGGLLGDFASASASVLAFSPSGELLVLESGVLLRFDASGTLLGTALSGLPALKDLEFGPDGDLYALSSSTQQVLRFDGETFAPLGVFCSDALLAGARAMDFGPSGDLFVLHSSGSAKGVRRYAAGTGAIVGQFGSAIGLDDPRDLAFGPDGNAYVTTREYGNSQTSVWAIDPESGTVLRKFADLGSFQGAHGLLFTDSPGEQPDVTKIIGIDGDGVNALERADGLAVFPDGTAYVSGVDSENVFRIDPDGGITEVLQAPASGSSSYAALLPDGTVFVSLGSAVYEIDPQGVTSVFIDSSTVVDGQAIGGTRDIATDLYGNLFVVTWGHRVVKITPSGTRSVVIDETGDGAGNTLQSPGSLAVGRNGHLYVAGNSSENIFEVEPNGTIRKLLPVPAGPHWLSPGDLAVDGDGNLYFASYVNDAVYRRAPNGSVIAVAFDVNRPGGQVELAVDKQGRLIVGTSDRVSLITPARDELELIGPGGAGAGNQLDVTRAIATDDAGGLYVSTGLGVLRAQIPPDCANGIDDDGDGFVDFPDDPGCFDAQSRENPECDDSIDNDGDGRIDWDGGPHGWLADPQCTEAWRDRERPGSGCGLGAELAFALVALGRWRRRRDHRLHSR